MFGAVGIMHLGIYLSQRMYVKILLVSCLQFEDSVPSRVSFPRYYVCGAEIIFAISIGILGYIFS